jgi:hypothetical protein
MNLEVCALENTCGVKVSLRGRVSGDLTRNKGREKITVILVIWTWMLIIAGHL